MTAPPSAADLYVHNQRVTRMLVDPECVGELLLVGIAMARSVDLADPPWPETGGMDMKLIADRVYGRYHQTCDLLVPDTTARGDWRPRRRILDVFRYDARRYDPDRDPGAVRWDRVTCGRPMVRRQGLCGRPATHRYEMQDPANGLRSLVGSCGQKPCRAWLNDLLARARAELVEHPPPVPPANCGGVLERHLPEIDWWKVWRAVDPNWSPPPEGRPFVRPTLQLLVSDGRPADSDSERTTARPALVALDGGWR